MTICDAIAARIRSSQPITGYRIDHDAVAVALSPSHTHSVSHYGKRIDDIYRRTIPLDVQPVREPWMMKARRIYGLLDGHAVIDDIQNELQRRVDDGSSTRAADNEVHFPAFRHDRRRHGT